MIGWRLYELLSKPRCLGLENKAGSVDAKQQLHQGDASLVVAATTELTVVNHGDYRIS